jgi:mxaA protein
MKNPQHGGACTIAALCIASSIRAAPVPEVETREPRAFGYQVGDLVQRGVVVHAPAGWVLDADSLPKPGARGQPLELRQVERIERREDGGVRHELQLQYQVFFAPSAVRMFELPALRLLLQGTARSATLHVDAWPVAVAPLVQPQAPTRRGLGELQPDREPFTIDLTPTQRWLRVWLLLAASALLALGTLHVALPWFDRRRLPFAQAFAELRRLPSDADTARWRDACKRLHRALDRSAGEVVFEHGLQRFVAARPAFAPLCDDLSRFLRLSRREFFAGATRDAADTSWLVELSRRCRDAERGT